MIPIPTHRSILRRIGARIWQALDDHKWLPLAIALVAAVIVNMTRSDQ
jgi:hypothetical protein